MLCSVCNENFAVVFITKIIDGKQVQEGLCMTCAKKRGVQPVNNFLEQTGMTEEDFDSLNKQMGEMMGNMDMDNMNSMMQMYEDTDLNTQENPLLGMLGKTFTNKNDNLPEKAQDIKASDGSTKSQSKVQEKKPLKKKKFLEQYGINLNEKAQVGKIDRVIGREKEINRVVQILNRRNKNNPVLIGEPGVGKTAIAEGLAVRIIERNIPAKLFGMEVYLLDLTSMVSGTQFRGQFESRMKGLIDEVKELGNIILVIDELHNIMGAGEADGAMNAANILKPALARGEIQVIGATTLNEYRKYIEKDSALERRFQPVLVEEPSIDETIEILKGIKHYYEEYHHVIIPDDVVVAAAQMSERYISDRFLPDKAIDIIDEAASRANLKNSELVDLETLKAKLKVIQDEKENAISADSIEDYQKAADLKVKECKLLTDIDALEKHSLVSEITIDDVATIIELWTKIPVQRLTEVESSKLMNLEQRLHTKVVGQDKAVEGISRAIRRNRAGFRKSKKPSSFIFVGPTGVGKTELVKALAIELFQSEEALIRLDMSEYMEKHTVSKLIGSPPGYVGYDDGGQLTEKVRRKPYSVILMDEIEKAHPDVFNMLLQIMDDGRLSDSHGRVVNFENTVIIMTSNAGTTLKNSGIGFGNEGYDKMESKIQVVLKDLFRPEFLNRVDEILVFTELSKDELGRIIELMLNEVKQEAKEKGVEISLTDKAKEFLIEKGYDVKYGARPLRRVIQKQIEDRLTEIFFEGKLVAGTNVNFDVVNGELTFIASSLPTEKA